MKLISTLLALCLAFMIAACEPTQSPADSGPGPKIAAEARTLATAVQFVPVIIRLNPRADLTAMSRDARARVIEAASERVVAQVPEGQLVEVHRYRTVPILSAWVTDEGLDALEAVRDDVKQVVLDRPHQAALYNSTVLIGADKVWPTTDGAGRLVAILDTGIHSIHPFVSARIPFEACFRRDKKCPGDSYERVGPGAAQTIARRHGPHVAGIAAGANGSFGSHRFNGVAPGAGIIAINIFSYDGTTYVGDEIKALEYVEELKVRNFPVVAANLSVEDKGRHDAPCDLDPGLADLKTAIDDLYALGVATVIAAGNSGFDDAVAAPGCITSAVTVSSVRDNGDLFKDNNRSDLTDLLAPGEVILSSRSHGGPYNGAADYYVLSGTSMAAPHVSGAIALLSAAKPSARIGQIIEALDKSGKEVKELKTGRKYKRIDVEAALAWLNQH